MISGCYICASGYLARCAERGWLADQGSPPPHLRYGSSESRKRSRTPAPMRRSCFVYGVVTTTGAGVTTVAVGAGVTTAVLGVAAGGGAVLMLQAARPSKANGTNQAIRMVGSLLLLLWRQHPEWGGN